MCVLDTRGCSGVIPFQVMWVMIAQCSTACLSFAQYLPADRWVRRNR